VQTTPPAGDYINAAAEHGLVTGFGNAATVGIGGSPWAAAWAT
jgi:hypothetical protein